MQRARLVFIRDNKRNKKITKNTLHTRDETMRCRRTDSAPIARHAGSIDPPATARYHSYRDTTGIKGIPHDETVTMCIQLVFIGCMQYHCYCV